MSKTNVVEVSGRDTIADPLNRTAEVRCRATHSPSGRSGARGFTFRAFRSTYSGWKSRCGAQWLPARTRATDGIGSGDGNDPQSTIEDGRGGDFSIGPGAPVREEDDESGSRGAVAVLEGDIQR